VDFEDEACEAASELCGECSFCALGEDFLADTFPEMSEERRGGRIAFGYLDNFDWISDHDSRDFMYRRFAAVQSGSYQRYGIEMNNNNSQAAHLLQAQGVHRHCTDRCVILFDDSWPTDVDMARGSPTSGLGWDGKGGTAVPWLLQTGEYEVMLEGREEGGRLVLLRRDKHAAQCGLDPECISAIGSDRGSPQKPFKNPTKQTPSSEGVETGAQEGAQERVQDRVLPASPRCPAGGMPEGIEAELPFIKSQLLALAKMERLVFAMQVRMDAQDNLIEGLQEEALSKASQIQELLEWTKNHQTVMYDVH